MLTPQKQVRSELSFAAQELLQPHFDTLHATDPRSGEQRESVCFVEIEAWNRQAEIIDEYLKKGSRVFVEGSLKFEQCEDDAGVSRNRLRVGLQRFELMGSPGENIEQVENAEPADTRQQKELKVTPDDVVRIVIGFTFTMNIKDRYTKYLIYHLIFFQ